MDDLRLKAKLLVQVIVRHCGVKMLPAYVTRKGDDDSGAVLVKCVSSRISCSVYQMAYGADGQRQWLAATGDSPVTELDADAFIERQIRYDEDVWVLEVEAPESWIPPQP